jgi:O-antigen ligase
MRSLPDGSIGGLAVVPLATDRARLDVRIATLFCVMFGGLFIGNLGRIPIFSTGGRDVPILANDFGVAMLVGAGALAMAAHRVFRIDLASGLALLFAGVGGVSAVLAVPRFGLTAFESFVSMSYLARWLFYFAIYLVAINTLRASDVNRVWRALETTILLFAAFGIFQSAFLPGFAQMVYPESRPYLDWDIQGRRLVSTWLDPNYAGGFIALGLIVSLARFGAGVREPGWKMLILAVALVLTVSRGTLLALFVGGFTLLVIFGLSKRILRALGVALVLVILALPKLIQFATAYNKLTLDPSALARLTSWMRGWQVLQDHWLIGIGYNTWGYVGERYGWERSYSATYGIEGGLLFILVMTGVIGLGLYVGMLWTIYANARRIWRNPEMSADARGLAIGAAASIPLLVVHSLFTNTLMYPFMMVAMWVLWALPFILRHGDDAAAHSPIGVYRASLRG